jgi:hypothetical protein
LSHPADPGYPPPANPQHQKGVAKDSDGRPVPNTRVSKRMKRFVNRMRLRLKDLDLTDPDAAARLDQAQEDMWSILKRKKISRIIANQIVAETLDAAVNHRLESLRRDQNLKHLVQANSNLNRLIKHVERLTQMLAKLPRPTKATLNKIMVGLNWRQFDTEVFAEFMLAILDVLSNVPASRFATDARSSIVDSLRSSNDRVATKINRTAPPAIVELWDIIPAATRTQVESNLRAWASVKKRSVVGFLDHLVALLKQHREKIGRGRHLAIEGRYVQVVAAIWRRHGLGSQIGLAFDHLKGDKGNNIEGRFQRFGRLALGAVGDRSGVSRWQVRKVKLRARCPIKKLIPILTLSNPWLPSRGVRWT